MKMREKTYNKQVDINSLTKGFSEYLQSGGWKVQQSSDGQKAVIQAQKAGILRDIISADRALTFTFENAPEGLKVGAGIGKWLQNIGVAVAEALLLSELFIVVDIPEMLWTEHVEKELIRELDQRIGSM